MSVQLTQDLLEKIVEEYIEDRRKNNISVLSKKYRIPYPTLRRHLREYLEKNNLEDKIREDQLPYVGFEYLRLGDTIQYSEELTVWKVLEKRRVDGDLVFVVVPTEKRAVRHWIGNRLVTGDSDV